MHAWVGMVALAAWLASGASAAEPPRAVPAAGHGRDMAASRMDFDIPPQPLATALAAYGAATGIAVLVDGELATGRTSAAVSGLHAPREALRLLLEGTGLVARYASPTAFTLAREEPVAKPSADKRSTASPGPEWLGYAAVVQSTLQRALCPSAQTRLGQYRAAMQVWIDKAGVIRRVHLLASTGIGARDAAIARTLSDLVIDGRPPAGLPQPLTLLLAPTADGLPEDCAGSPFMTSMPPAPTSSVSTSSETFTLLHPH
jgi:hypothetical protein